ncbi:APC family permease [Microbacterium azadirachtae]|uniref:Putative amino acid permease YhdG n=1 Tax=Microbacterium azadirachtae TaxID=582680 RepID=A0A0F0KQN0_9MICO|nr:APC family permease [Microbacterium azadirachtae]KJL21561.1 putative amino acid permease YhdG [Microbacterium azadirachtae]UXW84880.1 APC family permease [Microbacterium azadirachtae]SDM01779.1 amino acid/polyamine/organocation transporter, APC superfamily [Microbacterium azadirachtae]SEG27352.1 amino acid/polyamine/organocation transporter, APC superfamily [Microbacterium azadirachtae]SEG30381.1 amino acid/polyamine/organocation transporter, APC superfamily [Microbacterium azadirachtae]
MPLARRLTLADAVAIGLGSMIGAGVFTVWGPALGAAGSGVFVALLLAGIVAFCNATSSARLAAAHPVSGGAYAYGRAELGPWWGFIAGWCFVIGKLASCAAMAMTVAAYVAPPAWQRPVAIGVVALLTAVTCFGVTRTARLTQALVAVTLLGLAVVLAAAGTALSSSSPVPLPDGTAYGVLQAAGLLFFAFAGYARIATMGEEVRDPARTIPRAIGIALSAVLIVYIVVGAAVVLTLGGAATTTTAPLVGVVEAAGWSPAAPAIRVAAAAAATGALLALLSGIGRTSLAMARERDLPPALAEIDRRHHVPRRAQLAAGIVVVAVVAVSDLRGAIGFSSFGVLLYYLVANLSAFARSRNALRETRRRVPWLVPVAGAIGCVVLAATLPPLSVLIGAAVVAVGVALRALRIARDRRPRDTTTP